jgi:hypothetical protein
MTPKARWLATIDMQPVDRLPFWPKLDRAFLQNQQGVFSEMSLDEMHDWIGSDKHTWIGGCVKELRSRTSREVTTSDDTMQTIYKTRHGEMEGTQKFDPASQSWHPVTFPVRTPQDLQGMTEFYDDITVELDEDALNNSRKLCKSIGESMLIAEGIGESPLVWETPFENVRALAEAGHEFGGYAA